MQVDPVENAKKDIYIIKNDINSKVYIGQSKDTKERFRAHCKKCNTGNSIIDSAIQKYGKEHFWYEILESSVSDYNEREKYWIKEYNSLVPNGYNIREGGEDPPQYSGEDHPSAILSDSVVELIRSDLKETRLSLMDIAKKYGISKRQVGRINTGKSRFCFDEDYPLRKEPNSSFKLTNKEVEEIIHDLEFTYDSFEKIADKYGIGYHVVSKINKGKSSYCDPTRVYPIRAWKCGETCDVTYDQVTNIIIDLKCTSESMRSLANKYRVDYNIIVAVNSGKNRKYYRKTESYPIRSHRR